MPGSFNVLKPDSLSINYSDALLNIANTQEVPLPSAEDVSKLLSSGTVSKTEYGDYMIKSKDFKNFNDDFLIVKDGQVVDAKITQVQGGHTFKFDLADRGRDGVIDRVEVKEQYTTLAGPAKDNHEIVVEDGFSTYEGARSGNDIVMFDANGRNPQ